MKARVLIAVAGALAAGVSAAADADAARGRRLFDECLACHTVQRAPDTVGPALHGLFGRRAGTLEDFRYSPALRRSGIVWSPQTLDGFLADPQKVVPANRMPFAGKIGRAHV